jgi:hypothetical protein
MQYYTFTLDEESKDLTTILTPFGKYHYKVFLMGLKCLPNFAQETMENIFCNIDDAEVYIDNIGRCLLTRLGAPSPTAPYHSH